MNNKSTFKNIIFTYKYLLKDQSIPYYFIRSVLLSILNIFISFAQIFFASICYKNVSEWFANLSNYSWHS